MNFRKNRIWIIIAVCIIGIFVYSHRQFLFQRNNQNPPIPVSVATVKKANVYVTISAVGQVEPITTVNVSSQVSGTIQQVLFKEGDFVKANQVLFQIDPRTYQTQLEQTQANLINDQAQLANAQLTLKRYQTLSKNGYVSQEALDQAQLNVTTYGAKIAGDKAAVAQAQLNLSYCQITAPIDGRTGNILVNIGNVVSANDKTALVTINQMQPIYVSFTVPGKYLPTLRQIQQRQDFKVTAHITDKQEAIGSLTFINNTIDETSGTIQLKATFPNKDEFLWPGEYIPITLPIDYLTQSMVIPTLAVQIGQDGAYVFVLNKDNTVSYRTIKLGPQVASGTVVESGLKLGEKIITAGQLRLNDGSQVQVVKTP